MSVSKGELKCYEYINSIRDIEKFSGMSLYGLENRRTELHDDLCKIFDLTKYQTKGFTNNIDLNGNNPSEELYLDLLELSRHVNENSLIK